MDALKITLKDLTLLARDRRALVILVALPMVIIAIVGSSTGRLRANREQSRLGLTLEVADFDQTETSERLAGFMAGNENVIVRRLQVSKTTAAGDSSVMQLLSERPTGDTDVRMLISEGFEAGFRQKSRVEILSPDQTNPASLPDAVSDAESNAESGAANTEVATETGASAETSRFIPNAQISATMAPTERFEAIGVKLMFNETAADPMMEGLTQAIIKLSLQDALLPVVAEKVPVFKGTAKKSKVPEPWENTPTAQSAAADNGNRVYQFFIPSYTVLFVFFLVNIMGRSFLDERDMGTLRRLRIAPISPASILIGKTLPFLIMSLVQTTILMVSGKLLFGMSWGPQPWLLVPIMLSTSATATALGLMFSTIAKTESQVSSLGNLILLSSAGISGCLVPRAWMPPLTQKISLMTPHAWALDAYGELLTKDAPRLTVIFQSCGVLMAFSTVFFVIGLLRFRKE